GQIAAKPACAGTKEPMCARSRPRRSHKPPLDVLIAVDKTKQRMTIFVDGAKKYDWPASTGRPGYSTPSGTYTATSMNEVWFSKEWDNAPMPHAIFFMTDGLSMAATRWGVSGDPCRMAACA